MKKILITLSLILFTALSAQKVNFELLKGLKARSIGPAGTSGRITSIDVVKDQPHIIYIGTASGGVWKSESGGTSWKPIFDEQDIQNIGVITIDPSNPSVIWVGTGEGNPRNSHSSGKGIYKSLDGGKTWMFMGLENTKTIHRIIVDPRNSDIVYVASLGSIWGANEDRGVFKTIDGGKTWEKVLFVNDLTGAADLVMDPKNPNKLIAAMWEYKREPWFFTSGGKGSGIYVSYNGGQDWKKKTNADGLIESEMGRIGLAIAPSNPDIVYALVESKETALYKSTDGGEKWKIMASQNIGNRPFYYADIFVDPKNENRLFNLYSQVSVSQDGGKTFKVILPYHRVHPDHHAFYIHPENSKYIIDGNDGGLNISYNGGTTWEFVDNIPVSQFYHINVDNLNPYNVYGGMQDNGSWIGPGEVRHFGGIRNSDWQEILFGDGFDVMPKLDEPNKAYAMWQGGALNLIDKMTGETEYIKPLSDSIELRFSWNAALAQDPFDPNTIYFGSQHVHKSTDGGRSWKIISPDLTSNDSTKLKQRNSGGLTIDVTNAENHCTILSIAVSPINRNIIWVGTDDGKLHVSKDGGATWNEVFSRIKKAPEGAWIPQVRPSIHNAEEVFVVVNNYRQNDFATYLYHSTDNGNSWESIVTEDIKGYSLSFLQDPKEANLLYLGTEQGLYISIDKGVNWNAFRNNYPAVSTMDIAYQKKENDIILGTFGRSVYVLDNVSGLRELAQKKWTLDQDLVTMGNSFAYMVGYNRAKGERFMADGGYAGENEPFGANIDFYVNPKIWKKKSKAEIKIYQKGELVRNFKHSVDSGYNRLYWGLRKNGVRYPTYSEVKKDDDPVGGRMVEAGSYKVEIHYNDSLKATTDVRVSTDQQYSFDEFFYTDYEAYGKRGDVIIQRAFDHFEMIKEIKKGLDLFESAHKFKHDSLSTIMKDTLVSMRKSIKEIELMYMPDPKIKGYQYDKDKLMQALYDLTRYYGVYHQPSEMAEQSIVIAQKKLDEIVAKIDQFYKKKYLPFIKKQKDYPYLKEYEIK